MKIANCPSVKHGPVLQNVKQYERGTPSQKNLKLSLKQFLPPRKKKFYAPECKIKWLSYQRADDVTSLYSFHLFKTKSSATLASIVCTYETDSLIAVRLLDWYLFEEVLTNAFVTNKDKFVVWILFAFFCLFFLFYWMLK